MRRPLVIYDFVTAPFWISSYMRKIWFSSLSVYFSSHRYQSEPDPLAAGLYLSSQFPNQINQTLPLPSNNVKNAVRICRSRLPFPLLTFLKMMQENKKFVRVFYILFGSIYNVRIYIKAQVEITIHYKWRFITSKQFGLHSWAFTKLTREKEGMM